MKRLVIFPLTLLFALSIYGQGVTINGKLLVTSSGKISQLWLSKVLVEQDNKLMAVATVDTAGKFQAKIEDLKTNGYNAVADLFIIGNDIDTTFLKSIVLIKNSTVSCELEFPNAHDKNVLGDVTCPKCGKTNMTIPIVYGPWVGISHNKMGAGTDVKDNFSPEWYCKRCKIRF